MNLKERLKKDIVICAEGYLFELERRGYLKAGAFVPEVVLDYPEAVKELHIEFLRAGSDVVVAFTYYAHRDKLRVINRESDLEPMNRQALKIARETAITCNALVAGNICNTWVYDHKDREKTSKLVRSMYEEQVRWAKEEGADFIIAETLFFLGEALIALEVIKSFDMEAVIMLAPFHEKMRDGYSWVEACKILEDKGADVTGLNCAMGPETMTPMLRDIRKSVKSYVAALPVPYCTTHNTPTFLQFKNSDGSKAFPVHLEHFLMNRSETADFAITARDLGINFIGLCCGGAPHYIRSMAEALGRTVPAGKYSPDLTQHAMLGSGDVVKSHNINALSDWNPEI